MIRSAHARVFEQLIRDYRATLLESLVGFLSERVAGKIEGLDEALRISEEADRKLNGEQ